jgi:hypothetical protein
LQCRLLAPLRRARAQAREMLGEEQLPVIRLHDLWHTYATLLLAAGEPMRGSRPE